jgi:transcriptional regulator with XRE-family HTH domain
MSSSITGQDAGGGGHSQPSLSLADRQAALARRRLTTTLRKGRGAAGYTQRQVADRLDWSVSKVIRIEGGHIGVSTPELMVLLQLYGIDEQTQSVLLDAARAVRAARRRRASSKDRVAAGAGCRGYLQAATVVCQFAPLLVPPLLRTGAYAHAVAAWNGPDRPGRGSAGRAGGDEDQPSVLDGADAPQARFVVAEAVLWRPIEAGDGVSWREQLLLLQALAGRDRVDLRVLPHSAGLHAAFGAHGADTLLEFGADLDPVLVGEDAAGTRLVDDPDSIRVYRTMFADLQQRSQPAGGFLARVLAALDTGPPHVGTTAPAASDLGRHLLATMQLPAPAPAVCAVTSSPNLTNAIAAP